MRRATRGDRRRKKKQRWFDLGVAAAELVFGRPVPGYVCPLCIHAFPLLGSLTFEHVPPESLGGREVCLTCVRCNSTAGFGIDKELRRAQDEREWSRGVGKPLRATLEVGGIPVRVDLERTPEMVKIVGLPKHNNPADTLAHEEALRQALDEGEAVIGVKVATTGFNTRHVQVALLRSAYLAAFAALGCRYVLRSELDLVRRQIAHPDEQILRRFVLHRGQSHSGRGLAWVELPRSLESVVVKIDDGLVFLPGLKSGVPIYERLAERKRWPPRRNFFGTNFDATPFDWPTRPEHLLDQPIS